MNSEYENKLQNTPAVSSMDKLKAASRTAVKTIEETPYQPIVYAIPKEDWNAFREWTKQAVAFQPTLYQQIAALTTKKESEAYTDEIWNEIRNWGGGCDRKCAENGGEHCAESADAVESEQRTARTGWEDARAVYLKSRLEGNQSHQRIQGSAYGYEAVDHHSDCIDNRRFGDFKHGDLSSDEIRTFFRDEQSKDDRLDDEPPETDGWAKRKYDDLREQAELGNLYAGYRLSRILFDEDSPYYDEYDGAYYLESSAKQGYHVAQYRLGKMIYEGGYYRRIPENAEYWLLLSAKQNNPYAEALLGRLYLTGDFLRLDRKAGVDLLYDAIRHGNAHAAYTLGKYYADGKCLKKDIPKAIALLEQAAQMGDIHAEYRLAKIYLFESDCFDWQKAVEYLNTAAHKDNENAYRALQNMSQSTVISVTTGIADLVGDLSAMFDERPAVEDCTTMPEHRERKKYEYEQSL